MYFQTSYLKSCFYETILYHTLLDFEQYKENVQMLQVPDIDYY